jgi:hypothetical protein
MLSSTVIKEVFSVSQKEFLYFVHLVYFIGTQKFKCVTFIFQPNITKKMKRQQVLALSLVVLLVSPATMGAWIPTYEENRYVYNYGIFRNFSICACTMYNQHFTTGLFL